MLQFDVEPRAGYLYYRVSGTIDTPHAQNAYSEALRQAVRYGQARLLIDLTGVTGTWPAENRLLFGIFMADEHQRMQAQFAEPLRVAMLAVPPIMDPGRYTQAVANNRGVQMKTSESLAELLGWLLITPAQ
ncbi:MAG: STAS domain-containing protein [Clostridia bacterium]